MGGPRRHTGARRRSTGGIRAITNFRGWRRANKIRVSPKSSPAISPNWFTGGPRADHGMTTGAFQGTTSFFEAGVELTRSE